jgi:hypothetical protein
MRESETLKSATRAWVVRRHIRFRPGADCVASIDLVADRQVFTPSILALVVDEAYSGCGLVALAGDGLKEGDLCRVQVGPLPPIKAQVRWRRPLDSRVVRLALMYLD